MVQMIAENNNVKQFFEKKLYFGVKKIKIFVNFLKNKTAT
jgi:uncharacterized membrane protein